MNSRTGCSVRNVKPRAGSLVRTIRFFHLGCDVRYALAASEMPEDVISLTNRPLILTNPESALPLCAATVRLQVCAYRAFERTPRWPLQR